MTTRKEFLDWLIELGINPDQVKQLRFTWDCVNSDDSQVYIEVTQIKHDENGRPFAVHAADGSHVIATEVHLVPVTHMGSVSEDETSVLTKLFDQIVDVQPYLQVDGDGMMPSTVGEWLKRSDVLGALKVRES